MPRDDPHEFHRLVPLNNGDVIGRLKVEPELRACPEIAGQPGGGIRCDGPALMDNIGNAGGGDAEGKGEGMGRDAHRLQEFFQEDFPRMGANAHSGLLVVIHDFDTVRRAVFPEKANAPLGIDADAVLPGPVALELFQPVGGRDAQIVKGFRRVEHIKLAQGD